MYNLELKDMLQLSQKYKVSHHTFSSSKVTNSNNLRPCSAKKVYR